MRRERKARGKDEKIEGESRTEGADAPSIRKVNPFTAPLTCSLA